MTDEQMFDGEDKRILRRVSSPGLKGDGTSVIGLVVGEWGKSS
jgi:hypothetical protein